jgi:hypothetical protein
LQKLVLKIPVIIHDNCHYPHPPSRISLELKPTDNVADILPKIVEITQYPQDQLDIFIGAKLFEPESGTKL